MAALGVGEDSKRGALAARTKQGLLVFCHWFGN